MKFTGNTLKIFERVRRRSDRMSWVENLRESFSNFGFVLNKVSVRTDVP